MCQVPHIIKKLPKTKTHLSFTLTEQIQINLLCQSIYKNSFMYCLFTLLLEKNKQCVTQ